MGEDGPRIPERSGDDRDGLDLTIGSIVEILLSKGMAWDSIFDRTFDQVNLIVSKHFERQTYYFGMASQFLGGSSSTKVDGAAQPNMGSGNALQGFKKSNNPAKVDVQPIQDNPYPDGFGRA